MQADPNEFQSESDHDSVTNNSSPNFHWETSVGEKKLNCGKLSPLTQKTPKSQISFCTNNTAGKATDKVPEVNEGVEELFEAGDDNSMAEQGMKLYQVQNR